MVKKFLIDTCIWRDFYENRFSKSNKPLGEYASLLFFKIIFSKDIIIFSESLYWELDKDYNMNEINHMLGILFSLGLLEKITISKEEYCEAKKIANERNIPFIDCLNAIQARNNNAIIITRDKHFFKNLADIIKAKKPEEI